MTIPLEHRARLHLTDKLDVYLLVGSDTMSGVQAAVTLTPAESALLGQRLIDAADEAVHESRRRRREPVAERRCSCDIPHDPALPCRPGASVETCPDVGERGVYGPCVRSYPHPHRHHCDPFGRIW